jgi:hypothetical protein
MVPSSFGFLAHLPQVPNVVQIVFDNNQKLAEIVYWFWE